MELKDLINAIQLDAEWLETSDGDEHSCITLENLEGILSRYLNQRIKLKED